ncbi:MULTISPECIES: hypothetical protein [Halorussus]|uniref:hypothetical protein n=1 Tax=Halorussus TaxID=1070314 RepID=UPI00209F1605|nr:hypothetical protein [Halorussus vallis]USZ77892.1 hypothetical protein NGM07_22190 [Halorussus vallis]
MTLQTDAAGDGSPSFRLALLALLFAIGYVLGSRRAKRSRRERPEREPTKITIDDGGEVDE